MIALLLAALARLLNLYLFLINIYAIFYATLERSEELRSITFNKISYWHGILGHKIVLMILRIVPLSVIINTCLISQKKPILKKVYAETE